jgi:hypothetical protein
MNRRPLALWLGFSIFVAASGAILMLGTNRYAPGPAIITIGAVGCAALFGWLMLRQHD